MGSIATIILAVAAGLGWLASWPRETAVIVLGALSVLAGMGLVVWGLIGNVRLLVSALRARIERRRQAKVMIVTAAEGPAASLAPSPAPARRQPDSGGRSASRWTVPPELTASLRLPPPPSYSMPRVDLSHFNVAAEAAELVSKVNASRVRVGQEIVDRYLRQYGHVKVSDLPRYIR